MYLQIVQGSETNKSWLPKQRIDEVFSYLQFIAFFIWHAEIVFWLYMYQTLINQAQNFPLRYYLIPRRSRNGWRRKRLNRLGKFHQFESTNFEMADASAVEKQWGNELSFLNVSVPELN